MCIAAEYVHVTLRSCIVSLSSDANIPENERISVCGLS